MLGTLALSYADGNNFGNTAEDLRNAFLMLSNSFQDNVQKTIKSKQFIYDVLLSNKKLSLEQLAKLNASLFFDFYPDVKPFPGYIFIDNRKDELLRKILIKTIIKRDEIPEDIKVVGMIITPSCDLANRKYLHDDDEHTALFRVLYGLCIPISDYKVFYKSIDRIYSSQAHFITEPFWYSDKSHALIFHFGSMTSLWWNEEEMPRFEFGIKEHLAFDIQSKMANHANRLGNAMLSLR
jgi:hypothetical protein